MRSDYSDFLEKQRIRKEKGLSRITSKTFTDFTRYLSPEVPDNLKIITELTNKYNIQNSDAHDVNIEYDNSGNVIKQPPIFLYPPTINNKLQLITTPDQVCYIRKNDEYDLTDNFEVYNNLNNPNEVILITKKDNIPIVSLPFIVMQGGYSQELSDVSFNNDILNIWQNFNNDITRITRKDDICYKIKDNIYVLTDNFEVYNKKDEPNKIIIITKRENVLNISDKRPTNFDCTKIIVDSTKDTNFNFTLRNPKNTIVYFGDEKKLELDVTGNRTYYYGLPKNKKMEITFYGDFDGVDFLNCQSVVRAVQLKTSTITCYNMFKNCYNMEFIHPSFLISDNVTNMNNIFEGCIKVKYFPSSFRIGKNVTTIQSAFSNMAGLLFFPKGFTIPDKVENVSYAFDKLKSLKEFPAGFNMGKSVKQAVYTFSYSNIERLPNGFCFKEGITQLFGTFYDCKYLKELPNSFKIPDSVTSIYLMLSGCNSLSRLPKNFTFGKNTTDLTGSFQYTYALKYLPETCILGEKASILRFMFFDSGLTKLPINFTIHDNVTNCQNMFTYTRLRELPVNFKIGDNVSDCSQMFAVCEFLNYLNKNFFIGKKVQTLKQMFQESGIMIIQNLSIPDSCLDNSLMFYKTKKLSSIPYNFKTGVNARNCYGMFAESSISAMPTGFIFENEDNISYAFSGSALTKVIDFKISSDARNISGLFGNCIYLNINLNDILPESFNWEVNIAEMCYNCSRINSNAPENKLWNSSNNFTSTTDCFFNCIKIENYKDIPESWGGEAIKRNMLKVTKSNKQSFNYEYTKIEEGIEAEIELEEE